MKKYITFCLFSLMFLKIWAVPSYENSSAFIFDKTQSTELIKDNIYVYNFSNLQKISYNIFGYDEIKNGWISIVSNSINNEKNEISFKLKKNQVKDINYFVIDTDNNDKIKAFFYVERNDLKVYLVDINNDVFGKTRSEIDASNSTNIFKIDYSFHKNISDSIRVFNKISPSCNELKFAIYYLDSENKYRIWKIWKKELRYNDDTELYEVDEMPKSVEQNFIFLLVPLMQEDNLYCELMLHDKDDLYLLIQKEKEITTSSTYDKNNVTVEFTPNFELRQKGVSGISVKIDNKTNSIIKTKFINSSISYEMKTSSLIIEGMKFIDANQNIPTDKIIPPNVATKFLAFPSENVSYNNGWKMAGIDSFPITMILCLEIDSKDYYWTMVLNEK